MAIKKTHNQFLKDIDERNHKYPEYQIELLESEQYINLDTKLLFKCLNGHEMFKTSPRYIIQKGAGCPICGSIRAGMKNTNTHNSFIEKLEQRNTKYPPVYLVDGELYNGTYTELEFKCSNPLHSTWKAIPKTIIIGHGCPSCGNEICANTHQHTHDDFVELLVQRNKEYPHKQVFIKPGEYYQKQNIKMSFVCNHGHEWNTLPGDVIHRKIGCPFCASSKTFSFMAIEWLNTIEKQENIIIQHRGNSDKEFSIPGTKYTVDGYCKETNTVYEFHGNYWHGNPRLFNKDDINERVQRTYGELYSDTIKKEQIIKKLGYHLITMWEDEFDNYKANHHLLTDFHMFIKSLPINVILIPINQSYDRQYYHNQLKQSQHNNINTIFIFEDEWLSNPELIKQKLLHYSNINTAKKLHARKCNIREVNSVEKQRLLDSNHVQGNDNAQLSYGAFFNDILVAVMTFSAPRIAVGQKNQTNSNIGRWELSRFCTDVNYRIPGIASKLLKHFQLNNIWTEIYSYADKRWSIGNMYQQLGFELVSNNPPSYWYVINGQRKHRWNYRKDKLKTSLSNYNSELTEYENMQNHGFWRVWDCGTLKFSMVNK